MPPHPPASPAERRVLRWFLAAFFALALIVITATWWKRSAECASACAASGQAAIRLALGGGGRLSMNVKCECVVTPARKP